MGFRKKYVVNCKLGEFNREVGKIELQDRRTLDKLIKFKITWKIF